MTRGLLPLLLAALVLPVAAAADGLPAIETWKVDDHTTGFLLADRRAPLVQLHIVFPAGTWSRWGHDDDLSTAWRMSLYDPGGELRRRSDRLNAGLNLYVGSHSATVHASCLKEDLPEVVRLVRDVLANRSIDRGELRRWGQQRRIGWRGSRTNVQFRANQLVARTIFHRDDPRRRPYEAPAKPSRDVERLLALRDRLLTLPGRAIGVSGDVSRRQAEELAATLLPPASTDAVPDLGSALRPLRPRSEWAEGTERIERLTQVYFGLMRDSLSFVDDDYPAFVLANHVLGGHFYSRLNRALRHDGGETYGAFARSWGGLEPGPLVLASFTRTDNAPAAEAKMRGALAEFHEQGISADERSDAAGHFLGRAPHERQWPASRLSRRMSEWRLGLPAGFWDGLPDRIAALSLEEINDFIARYYDPEAFVMGRVAPLRPRSSPTDRATPTTPAGP